jgi:hypothetical protein
VVDSGEVMSWPRAIEEEGRGLGRTRNDMVGRLARMLVCVVW